MRVNWRYIKGVALGVLLLALAGFANQRNNKRSVALGTIKFEGANNLYITHEAVNKLLIQNGLKVTGTAKDAIDLNGLESALVAHEMIQDAEVYLTVDGRLSANVKQRLPIARVLGKSHYYIDAQGKKMPLSPYHAARVPMVSGITNEKALQEVYEFAKFIQTDDFLKKHVVAIVYDEGLKAQLRGRAFEVDFGAAQNLQHKAKKLMAFYQKAIKDNALDSYKTVNLKYSNQVVCTKK